MVNQKKTAGCGTLILLWAIVAMVLGVLFSAINKTEQSMGSIAAASMCISLLIVLVKMAFRMAILTSKTSKATKMQREKDRREGISRYDSLVHVGGLMVLKNCKASVILSPTELTINCGGSEFILNIAKIKNVDFQLDVNETKYLQSSFVKGVAGAAFGMTGAIIGSAPKTKTKRNVKGYAIISYEDAEGQYKTFLLRDEIANTRICSGLVDNLRPRINRQINRVEL